MPNSYNFTINELNQLLLQLPKPYLIMGDVNSHSFTWGSYKLDSRGETIEQLLENPDIALLNNSEPTHINSSYNTFSAIDLTMADSSSIHKYDWMTLEVNYTTPKWKYDRGAWETYQLLINEEIETISHNNTPIPIDEELDNLVEVILSS